MPQARKWQLTLNNPADSGYAHVRRSGERSGRRSSIPTALDEIPPSAGAVGWWEHNPVPIANKTVVLFFSAVGCP